MSTGILQRAPHVKHKFTQPLITSPLHPSGFMLGALQCTLDTQKRFSTSNASHTYAGPGCTRCISVQCAPWCAPCSWLEMLTHDSHFLQWDWKGTSCHTPRARLKSIMERIGLQGYSGHSFCRGGATHALHSGVPTEMIIIKVQGDWQSLAYLKYIDSKSASKRASHPSAMFKGLHFVKMSCVMYVALKSLYFHMLCLCKPGATPGCYLGAYMTQIPVTVSSLSQCSQNMYTM